MFRTLVLVVSFCFFGIQAKSQLLFNFINLTVGLIQTANEGGYEGQFTLYNNSPCYIHGLKAGWHAGDHFTFGYSLHYSNNTIPNMDAAQNFKLYQLETGLYFEYVSNRTNKHYWSIPLNLNYGAYLIPDEYVPANYISSTGYFSIEPRVQYAYNLDDWIQVNASAGYRIVSCSQRLYGTNNAHLSGPTVNFALIFGRFR